MTRAQAITLGVGIAILYGLVMGLLAAGMGGAFIYG